MPKLIIVILLSLVCQSSAEGEDIHIMVADLIPYLAQVESNHNPMAVGDSGNALGVLQIWDVVVQDVNRVSGSSYVHTDAYDVQTAQYMCVVYLTHYGKHYERTTGRPCTYEVLARMWNGGPKGYTKEATDKYWDKVLRAIRSDA